MKSFRLDRLFHPRSRRCFDVAIDHGFFNEHSFLGGIEDIERAVVAVAEAGPAAIARALMGMVHDGLTVDAPLKLVER